MSENVNKNKNHENNIAFVDGQNLYLGTNSENPTWKVDLINNLLRRCIKKCQVNIMTI